MLERIYNYRRERTASHEMGEANPSPVELCYPGEKDGHNQLPPEIEEGGLVDPWIQSDCRPQDLSQASNILRREYPAEVIHKQTPGSTLYELNPVRHWEQRRRMRRVNDTGKR